MVLEGNAFVTYSSYFKLQWRGSNSLAAWLQRELLRECQNSPNCPVISVAKSSSRKGKIPSATGWSWRVR